MMRSGSEFTDIGEIQILGDQEASIHLGSLPDDLIGFAIDPFILNCVDFVAKPRQNPHQRGGKILV